MVRLLTARQLDCLRLVLAHYSSKEIARELGISHHTVNKTLEGAMRRVGAPDRLSAARMLAAYEHGVPYDGIVTDQIVDDPIRISSRAVLVKKGGLPADKSGAPVVERVSRTTGSHITKSSILSSVETTALPRATPPRLGVSGIFLVGLGIFFFLRHSTVGRRT